MDSKNKTNDLDGKNNTMSLFLLEFIAPLKHKLTFLPFRFQCVGHIVSLTCEIFREPRRPFNKKWYIWQGSGELV